MEIFWKTIAYYNSSTWLPQIFIVITGLVLTVLLVRKPRRWIKEAMKIYLLRRARLQRCDGDVLGTYGSNMDMGHNNRIHRLRAYL